MRYFSRSPLRVAWIATFVGAAALGACSTFSAADDSQGGGADGAVDALRDDGGSMDAADEAVPSADAAPAENLAVNGDFELGCSGWTGPGVSSVTPTTPAHGGTNACTVCTTQNAGFALFQVTTTHLLVGRTFAASSWIRSAPDASAPLATAISVTLATYPADGTTPLDQLASTNFPPALEWQEMTGVLTITVEGAKRLALRIGPDLATSGACFVIDDIVLHDVMP